MKHVEDRDNPVLLLALERDKGHLHCQSQPIIGLGSLSRDASLAVYCVGRYRVVAGPRDRGRSRPAPGFFYHAPIATRDAKPLYSDCMSVNCISVTWK